MPETPKKLVSSRAEFWVTTATRSPGADPERVEAGRLGASAPADLGVRRASPRRGRLIGLVDDADSVGIQLLGAAEEVVDGQRQPSWPPTLRAR